MISDTLFPRLVIVPFPCHYEPRRSKPTGRAEGVAIPGHSWRLLRYLVPRNDNRKGLLTMKRTTRACSQPEVEDTLIL